MHCIPDTLPKNDSKVQDNLYLQQVGGQAGHGGEGASRKRTGDAVIRGTDQPRHKLALPTYLQWFFFTFLNSVVGCTEGKSKSQWHSLTLDLR